MNLQQFYNDTLTNGGASFNILTGEYNPDNGYMLAIKGHELQVPLNNFNQKVLSDYIKSKADILMSGITTDKFIGSWVNDGIVYLDCSIKYLSASQAIQTGIENGELAIWDNFLKASIPCNELALESAMRVDLINNSLQTKEMKKEFRVVSNHEVYEDNYNDGELQYANGYTLDGIYRVDNWQQAVENHFNENGLSIEMKNCEIEDGILYTSCLVNSGGVQPFNSEFRDYKNGLINLYGDIITVNVQELVTVELK